MKAYTRYILAFILFNFSWVSVNAQQTQDANAHINVLLKILPSQKEDTNKIKLLNDLSYSYNRISPFDGIKFGMQSRSLAEELHWEVGIARANSAIGANYFSLSDFPNAYKYWLAALKINEELGNNTGIANHLHNIGNIYFSQRNYTEALEYYNKALQLNEKTGSKKLVTNSYTAIGNVYTQLKDYGKALEYHFKALSLDQQLGLKSNIAADQINIGAVYNDQGDYSKALAILFQALRTKKEIGDKNGSARTYNMIGSVFLNMTKYTSTEKNEHAATRGISNNLEYAVVYLDSAIMTDKEIGYLDNMQKSYEYLAEAQEMMHSDKEALDTYKKYVVIKDSIFSLEKNTEIFNLEKKAEIEEKNIAVEKEREEKERKEFIQICGICMFIVIFIPAVMLLRKKRVNPRIIEVLGTISILMVFEFVQLLLHGQIEKYTHDNIVLTLICLIILASIIIPFHHKIEHWMKKKLDRK